jgi:hypothetical protein
MRGRTLISVLTLIYHARLIPDYASLHPGYAHSFTAPVIADT